MRTDCTAPAIASLGLELYPHKALMALYKSDSYLTRLVIGLFVCEAHFTEARDAGPFELLPRDKLMPLARVAGSKSGIAVDLEATKVCAIALDDHDLLMLDRARRNAA